MSDPKIRVCIDRLTPLGAQRRMKRYLDAVEGKRPEGGLTPSELALETANKWPNGSVLKCRFLDGIDALQERVAKCAHQWSEYANIRFEFIAEGAADIRISFLEEGSWSYVGKECHEIFDQSQPTMNFGWLTPTSTDEEVAEVVLHEFGHAIGCIHEHMQPANGIKWNKDVVYKYYMGYPNYWSREQINANLFYRYKASQTQYSDFDPTSIMMYPVPKEHTVDGWSTRGGSVLSDTDKKFIALAYPKPPQAKEVTRLELNAPSMAAEIGERGEEDLYEFELPLVTRCTVETLGTSDMMLFLYDEAGALLTQDDDGGIGLNARIVREALPAGKYKVRVRHYSKNETGRYSIRLYSL